MKYRNDLKRRVLAGLFAGAALCLAAPAVLAAGSPVANDTLPQLPNGVNDDMPFVAGSGHITRPTRPSDAQMTIHQTSQNGVIVWEGFNVGANATVNFEGPQDGYNTLNYDKGGSMSQIYGTINANNNGNIYIVNPSGVEIGNSAQINVGSLYVSNKNLADEVLDGVTKQTNITNLIQTKGTVTNPDAVLMSLGNINANNVTFDGNRIVIDTERLKDAGGDAKLIDVENGLTIRTTNADNVVIGYDAYDEVNGYTNAKTKKFTITEIKTGESGHIAENAKEVDGYMWVEDVEQLQAIKDNLDGNYALRNSIDATATQDWNDANTDTGVKEGFQSIGTKDKAFTGKFDGLDYNIFNLNINRADETNVGLFGVVGEGAVINNVTLVGGSINGQNNVGALAGSVQGGAHISNITNSASVTGASNVGGIVGASVGTEEHRTVYDSLINTGTITSSGADDKKGGYISNAGGLIGYLEQGDLGGTSYNLGAVTGRTGNDGSMIVGYNVGGLVGHAVNSVIGNEDMIDEGGNVIAEGTTVYNRLNVTGAYNVGGIVGAMEDTTVLNAENSSNVLANGQVTDTYIYHTDHSSTDTNGDGPAEVEVYIANAGGIAGSASGNSTITDVLNTGNVSSASALMKEEVANVNDENDKQWVMSTYYTAGNVGGIVGSAVNTNITNATNRENEVRGAHNVGGIAGYFANSENAQETDKYTVTNGVNDGGDIMATGARNGSGFVSETIRSNGREPFTIGNMGGIVGYMDGDDVYIASSANRGTVHTLEPENPEFVGSASKAANAGGIVGKIDRSNGSTLNVDTLKTDYSKAAVSNSYNTGDVMGYTGIGGIAGMMYNGEIAGSYNLGYLRTTRQSDTKTDGSIDPINMGGIVGDTTEESSARALLYDVYNKGQIGDKNYDYFGRHVGGIVGRLSGTVEKAYNTGAIYNGYNVVGGIAGWMYAGSINNAFNTGNITVVNKNHSSKSQVGGIVGAADVSIGNITLSNVYNLGTLRSFWGNDDEESHSSLGGIIGGVYRYFPENGQYKGDTVYIYNAYTTGNLYINDPSGQIGSIYTNANGASFKVENTYYIKPDEKIKDSDGNPVFTDLSEIDKNNSGHAAINFDAKDQSSSYEGFSFSSQSGGDVNFEEGADWRIYEGSTPILNAFLPNAEDYFDRYTNDDLLNGAGIGSIQYGTAYDPLLTIIKANGDKADLKFNWQELGINNDAGLAVYGAGLTLNDFMATGGSGYFGGLIYSDGALTIKADTDGGNPHSITGDVALGSASKLYGSSVTIKADGQVTIYGSVTATGNTKDGTTVKEDGSYEKLKNFTTDGRISITGGNVDIYGQLTSGAVGETVKGIGSIAEGWTPGDVSDQKAAMSDIGDRFGYTTSGSAVDGNIAITANDAEDGHVNVYYGNKGEGIVITGGDLTVTASGDVYMDSDLSIGGNLTLNAGYKEGEDKPAADSEAVLDISNIGKVQAANDAPESKKTSVDYLHEFMHHFAKNAQDGGIISFTGGESKIAVDMWDEESNEGKGGFNLDKFDIGNDKFVEDLNHLNFTVAGDTDANAQKYTYIWVSTGEQLKGIQQYKKNNSNSNILSYNFALKNDIDASDVTDYEAIGTNSQNGYTGTFDGRDNRIIGLDTTKKSDGTTQTLTNAGIFDTIGAGGTVEDLRVYSGTFTGKDNAGAVAGVNKGNISNVTAFGNVVTAQGSTDSTELGNLTEEGAVHVGAAGGIAGVNYGIIDNASAVGTATAADAEYGSDALSTAGGIAGINMYDENINKDGGIISNSTSNSAVNASAESTYALGGAAGVNSGTLENVDSLGVTTGIYQVGEHNPDVGTQYSDNVGGIAGINQAGGTVESAYNESIVSGRDNVGGILGKNSGTNVSNVANASKVTGEAGNGETSDFVGGLVGDNEGNIDNGRNNGEITGNNYVGGLVGANGKDSTLTNLVNDESAAIIGDNYVGGIAGTNEGTISAENQDNLINRGTITGQKYVGGVAGENIGTIEYIKNDIDLIVRDPLQEAMYFGGVAGVNGRVNQDGSVIKDKDGNVLYKGTITSATNQANIVAPKADYVGGIVGWNTAAGDLEGMGNSNEGRVEGASHVGGVAGKNDADIAGTVASMVGIENSGVVIAHNGGAGGIFGENTGDIEYVEITNKGIVSGSDSKDDNGTDGTGGIFGVNSGDVQYSSMKNEIGGQVMGTQNVGGLIGVNTGNITGGRDENDGYYKYQIYNNGTITVEGNGTNIGGLIGNNAKEDDKTGSLTAGYNTGVIHAYGSENVGGIAGTNTGELNQVFNTVINVNEDGSTAPGSITGHANVGGIAGTNSGTISDAYNTSTITGTATNTITGSIAGTNDGSISNVYGSEGGKLVDNLVGSGTVSNVYDEDANSFGKDGASIDFKGGEEAIWRQYGDNNPILKVFLTTVTYDEMKNNQSFTYNGKDQKLDIGGLITSGAFDAADDFAAHGNVQGGLIFHDKETSINAGKYTDDFWSIQIGAGIDGNPNNLGYDVQSVKYKIGKATIGISLDNIYRLYGSENMYQDANRTQGSNAYEDYWHISVGNADDFDQDALNAALESIRDNAVIVDNGKGTNGRTTADAGDHNWQVNVNISDIASNFQLKDQEGATTHSYEYANGSHVAKAELTVTVGNVETTYGTAFDPTKYGYTLDGVTNGDTSDAVKELIGQVDYTNDAAKDGTGGVWTADAGTYTDAVGVTQNGTALDSVEDLLKNYTVKVDKGNAQVNKAELEIIADDKEMYAGDTIPAFTGTDISSQFVNGDTLSGWYYGPEGTVDSSVGGSHIIGVYFGNGQYAGSNSFDWTTAWDGFKNYNVTFTPGTLTVRDFPEGMPDISDIPSIERHWNFLFDDNPWDRNRDFRERKAEVHFVAGGMTL